MNFGSGHRCPRCEGRVYAAEEVIAMGHHWHKSCFLCGNKECNKRLDSRSCAEHEGEAFCTHCHRRFFGPKGYGFGGGAGTLSMDDGGPAMDMERKRVSSPEGAQPLRQANNIFKRQPSASTLNLGSCSDKCARCGKTVYLAERMNAAGKSWHRAGCFTCTQCNKRLEAGALCEKDGDIFCKMCYGRSYGPKGYGYGVGAGTLQSEVIQ